MEPAGSQTPHGHATSDLLPSRSPTPASEDVAGCPTTPSTAHGSSGTSPSGLRAALATPLPRTSRAQIEHFAPPEASDVCVDIARRYLEETYQVQSKNPAALEMAQVRLLLMQELATQEDVIYEMEQRYNELIAASQLGGLLRGWDGLVTPKKSLDTLPKDVRKFYVEATKKKDHAFSFTSATSQVYDNRPEWIQNLHGRFMNGGFRAPSGPAPLAQHPSDVFFSVPGETENASSHTVAGEERGRIRSKAALLTERAPADLAANAALDSCHTAENPHAMSPSQRLQKGSSTITSTPLQPGLSTPGGGPTPGSRKSLRKSAAAQHFKHAAATQDTPILERSCETTLRGTETRIGGAFDSPTAAACASPAIAGTMALASQRSAPSGTSLTPRNKHQASSAPLHGKGRISESSHRVQLTGQRPHEELTTEGCFSSEPRGSVTRAPDGARKRVAVATTSSPAAGEGTTRSSGAPASTVTTRHSEMAAPHAHGTANANTPASSLRRRSRSMSHATYQQEISQYSTSSSATATPLTSNDPVFAFSTPDSSTPGLRDGPTERTTGPSTALGYGGPALLADDGSSSVVSQAGSSISSTLTRSRGAETKGDQRPSKKKKKKTRL